MARDLGSAIYQAYLGVQTTSSGTNYYWGRRNNTSSGKKKYLEIPINEDYFELPVFAIEQFINLTKDNKDLSTGLITAMLYTYDRTPRYKSLDVYMRDMVMENFTLDRLVKCEVKNGNEMVPYYCTHGAVFDNLYNPIMMFTWQMRRIWLNEETRIYKFIKPILRISPDCYISQQDAMQRWIVKKAAAVGLGTDIRIPFYRDLNDSFVQEVDTLDWKLTVEICNSPFKIKTADVPSISTTNENLLQLAIDHIEEIIV